MGLFEELMDKATSIQQDFYELTNDWNSFGKDDHVYLKDYIGYGMYGPPKKIANNFLFEYQEDKQKQFIELIYNKITESAIGFEDIHCVVIYNVVFDSLEQIEKLTKDKDQPENNEEEKEKTEKITKDKEQPENNEEEKGKIEKLRKDKEQPESNKEEKEKIETSQLKLASLPIYKIRRKIEEKECSWFIDGNGRVYVDWQDYLTNNVLWTCTMVVPKDGIYQPDLEKLENENVDCVLLESHQSPACSQDVLNTLDTVSLAVSFGSMAVCGASLLTPIGPLVVGAGLLAGSGAGLYSAGRSVGRIYDRVMHSDSLTNMSAVGDYIGVGSSVVGVATAGSAQFLSNAASKGQQIGRAAMWTHNVLTFSTLGISGFGIAFRVYSMYSSEEPNTRKDWVFLATDLFFFTLAVRNINTAKNLVEAEQQKIIKEHRSTLLNKRQRYRFNRSVRKADNNAVIVQKINKINENRQVPNTGSNTRGSDNNSFMKGSNTYYNSILTKVLEKYGMETFIVLTFQMYLVLQDMEQIVPNKYEDLLSKVVEISKKMAERMNKRENINELNKIIPHVWAYIRPKIQDFVDNSTLVMGIVDHLVSHMEETLKNLIRDYVASSNL